jgi:ABC-type polysaccharide/polyol phosphate export permease
MTAPMASIDEHSAVVKSTGFPLICLFAASFGRYSFEMLVRLVVVVPVLISLTDLTLTGVGMATVLLLPATAFGIAIGVMIGMVGIVLRDLKNIADIFFRYMIFLSFALFPLSLEGVGWWWYTFNPFAIFIDNIRSVLLLEQFVSPVHFLVLSLLSVALLVIVLHLYYVLERRIAGAL